MANIKKNFNFRNGVQVDDDNLLVTSTGLVGIGTTIPSEALDVRGNAIISGFTSITSGSIGVVTITTLDPTQIIGAGVSIKSGIITAQGSGIVTFFGDARFLQGMPTSQWQDVDVGLGYTSIFNTGGNVGIATTDPRTSMQVGNNVDAGQKGVGISSVGNVNASGIITATSFVGDLTGNIVSNTTISGNVDLNADLDVDGHTNLDNASISGIATVNNLDVDGQTDLDVLNVSETATFSSPIDLNSDLDVDGHTNLDNLSVSGVTTFSGSTTFNHNLTLNADIDIDGHANIDNLNVSGVTTFAQKIEGAATNNVIPFLYNNMTDLPSASTYHGAIAHVHATGSMYYAHAGGWYELVHVETSGRVGTSTENYDLNYVGAASTVHTTKLGVGTTEAPANDIQLRKSGNAEIQITSETGIAGLSFGREPALQKINAGEIRFGGGPGFNFSSSKSLDIINYSTGNFNYHLSANNPAAVEGDFIWHRGANSAKLMTLTGIGGSLGIGITNPSDELHVVGGATITGTVTVGNSVNVDNLVSATAVISTLTGKVTGNLDGNVNASTGISTFNNMTIGGIGTFSDTLQTDLLAIGGGTATSVRASNDVVEINPVQVSGNPSRVFVRSTGEVGFKQTAPAEIDSASPSPAIADISAGNCIAIFKVLSVGQDKMGSSVDFSNAGVSTARFMLPPKVSTSGRGNLQNVVAGAVIYNTSTNKLQVFNGSAWQDCN